jgi:serine/threonine protein kinase
LTEDQLKLLRREVRILEKINHPNIVDVVEVYDYDEAQLIVFEIMNGGEVYNFLNNYLTYYIF